MADGTIKIGMELDGSGLGAQADAAGKDAANKAGASFSEVESKGTSVFSTVAKVGAAAFAAVGSAAIAFGGMALSAYSNYEQLSGGVAKLYGSGQTLVAYAQEQGKAVAEVRDEYNSLNPAVALMSENASKAWQTAGMSANQYMEQATGFSAALINSLGGDTVKAAQQTDVAIRAMSDNVNTFGTNMEDVQNAFQGFAKGNFTMLDNLKLGYAGTKEGMQQLIDDANAYAAANGQAADLSIDSFSDIVTAIELVQEKQGIAGTTAREAATTIEGSANMMKASWQNLLTGIADDNADFGSLVNDFVESLTAFAGNIIPRVQQIIEGGAEAAAQLIQTVVPQLVQMIPPILNDTLPTLITAVTTVVQSVLDVLPTLTPVITSGIMQIVQSLITLLPEFISAGMQMLTALMQGIIDALPQLVAMLPSIVQQISDVLIANLPLIITTGVQLLVALINGLTEALPQLIAMLPTIINTIVTVLIQNLPLIITAGMQLLAALIRGLTQAIPQLIAMLPTIISTIVSTLAQHGPEILQAGVQIIQALVSGIGSMLGDVGSAIGQVASTIGDEIGKLPDKMLQWGKDMIQGLIDGIKSMIDGVGDAVKGVADKIASFLHFSRPDEGPLREYEQWMPDMIEGMSETLAKASPALINQTQALAKGISDSMQIEGSISGSAILDALGGAVGGAIGVSLGWDREDPFGSLRRDVKLGIDGVQMDFKQQGAVFGFVSDKGQQPPKVEQHFETKVVRSDDDLYSAAAILHRNALAEAMGAF